MAITPELHIYYQDFANNQGRLRMGNDIADITAKTFASYDPPPPLPYWLTKALRSLLSGPLIDIYVGMSRQHWCLHQDLLSYHTPFFQKKNSDNEKQEHGAIDLLEEDPQAFELLIKWLYQGRLDNVSDMPLDKKWDYADSCQKLHVLCDKIDIPQLKDLAIDQYRKGCNEAGLVPGPEEIKPIYDATSPNSPLRKLVSQIAARQIMDPESEGDAASYRLCFESSADFAIDVVAAIRQGSGPKLFDDPTEEGNRCCYHEHGAGQMCKVG